MQNSPAGGAGQAGVGGRWGRQQKKERQGRSAADAIEPKKLARQAGSAPACLQPSTAALGHAGPGHEEAPTHPPTCPPTCKQHLLGTPRVHRVLAHHVCGKGGPRLAAPQAIRQERIREVAPLPTTLAVVKQREELGSIAQHPSAALAQVGGVQGGVLGANALQHHWVAVDPDCCTVGAVPGMPHTPKTAHTQQVVRRQVREARQAGMSKGG
jgi:hypothetical protein